MLKIVRQVVKKGDRYRTGAQQKAVFQRLTVTQCQLGQ